MSRYMQYYLPLNKSTLVFFPPSEQSLSSNQDSIPQNGHGYVVQVMIKSTQENPTIEEITTAFIYQYEITKAVESIIFARIFMPLPTEIRVEGKGYVLHGRRKTWVYGKSLQLKWGEICVRPCEDKWVFVLEVIPDRSAATRD
ncbi:hypothetical protein BYT27DRAFT_7156558 [Phlegmacium glaucopus]|nr:hypothetical protein BYT27DRAFT_7156558 [Phlegmacium glaucopus]